MLIGPNGLITKASEAKEKTEIVGEREYLEQNVLSIQLEEYTGDVSSEKLGAELVPKNIEHAADWHYVKVEGKNYGRYDTDSGWNFVEKGATLPDYGIAQHSWLVNYETGEIIELEEGNYTDVSVGDMVAVTDNLIINVDSSLVDTIDEGLDSEQKEVELEKQLGNGADLHGFSFSDGSSLTSSSFNFDGVDDYITFNYNDNTKINGGFTLEFYGKIKKGGKLYEYDEHTEFDDPNDNILNGFVELSDPNDRISHSALGFGLDIDEQGERKIKQLAWRLGNTGHAIPYGFEGAERNIGDTSPSLWDHFCFEHYKMDLNYEDDVYFSVSMDEETNTEKIYFDGKEKAKRNLDR